VKERPDYAVLMAPKLLNSGNADSAKGILGAALGVAPDLLDVRLRLVT
jgi:hypothetical protein